MLIAFILFLSIGIMLGGCDSVFASVSLIGCSMLCLLCHVKGAMRWKDISPIVYRLINAPTVFLLLGFGLYHSEHKLLFVFVMLVWTIGSLVFLPLWYFMVSECSWNEKYREICTFLSTEEKFMLESLKASTDIKSFRAFIRKFNKQSVQKIISKSKEDEMFLNNVRDLIEAGKYKKIKAMIKARWSNEVTRKMATSFFCEKYTKTIAFFVAMHYNRNVDLRWSGRWLC